MYSRKIATFLKNDTLFCNLHRQAFERLKHYSKITSCEAVKTASKASYRFFSSVAYKNNMFSKLPNYRAEAFMNNNESASNDCNNICISLCKKSPAKENRIKSERKNRYRDL